MKLVGQPVDDRHTRVLRKALDLVLAEGSDHDQIDHAADDLGAVLDGLGASELAVASGEVHHRAAQLVHPGFKAHTRARGGFLENHGQRAIRQRLVLLVGLELALDERGALKQVAVFGRIQVGKLQVVLHGFKNCVTIGARMDTISSASAGVMMSGGTKRMTLSAVTLNNSPASSACCMMAPQGRSNSMPIIRP